MAQPPHYAKPGQEHLICKLNKALYGLKQAGWQWHKRLSEVLALLGFQKSVSDHAVFYRISGADVFFIPSHVDNLTLISNSKCAIESFKTEFKKHLEITDLGDAHWLLGIEICHDRVNRTLLLSQTAYIDLIVERFEAGLSFLLTTPMVPKERLSVLDSPDTAEGGPNPLVKPYQEIIGSLMYAAVSTCPNICYATSALLQFLMNPGKAHMEAARRIIQYLKYTRTHALHYGTTQQPNFFGYSDANWASNEGRKSIASYVFMLNGGAVSWSSQKQASVAMSSTEAKYIALAHATSEALWFKNFFLSLNLKFPLPIPLYCDNLSSKSIAENPSHHSKAKHIDIHYHFVCDNVESGNIAIKYISTEDMVADICTKALAHAKNTHFSCLMGLSKI
jgi:hypothetical protein